MTTPSTTPAVQQQKASVLRTFSERMGLDPAGMFRTLVDTIFPSKERATPEQVNSFLIVANEYGLNPFTREIFAFPSKGGGITPIVSIDGWLRLMNQHPQLESFVVEDLIADGKPVGCKAKITRKDRKDPMIITEWISECKRNTDPWKQQPSRMIRHKATIQCIRYAFGFAGIFDADEAAAIRDAEFTVQDASQEAEELNLEISGAREYSKDQEAPKPAEVVKDEGEALVEEYFDPETGEVVKIPIDGATPENPDGLFEAEAQDYD